MIDEFNLLRKEEGGADVEEGENEDADDEEFSVALPLPSPPRWIPLLPSVESRKLDANLAIVGDLLRGPWLELDASSGAEVPVVGGRYPERMFFVRAVAID